MAKKIITFDEYDALEQACEEVRMESETTFYDDFRQFNGRYQYPTTEELEAADVEHNFSKYFDYLFFFYTQPFDDSFQDSPVEYQEYKKSMEIIKRLMKEQLVFRDDDE